MPKPNVILVITDDQGYGDLGCTGNPYLRTPCIDRFATSATRLVDFHASPLCTPTRGALMCGRNPLRNGAWATTWGRSMLRREEVTMAEVFAEDGYATGMFGKWHLGDNYPYRPQDRGFATVVAHRGGGVGQTPDFWGNTYFDDTYFRNGSPEAFNGYCTDVWFAEAMKFIHDNRSRPFFCYLATNAPHAPYRVDERYARPYQGRDDIPEPEFYGMIANIDENMGRLLAMLDETGLAENSIVVFMTDNGTSGGWSNGRGYNAGMRGVKGSLFDGGHRVPCFFRWPRGGLVGRDVGELITHMDLLPTFVDLCRLPRPRGVVFDGQSVAEVLAGRRVPLDERVHVVQFRQGASAPDQGMGAVMTGRWRLIEGKELYDIQADPGQHRDVASEHADVVAHMRRAYEGFWNEVADGLDDHCPVVIGSDDANPVRLDAFDLMGDVAWDQSQIRKALKVSGAWAVDVARAGRYAISLQRWPREAGLAIDATPSDDQSVAIEAVAARLRLAGFDRTVLLSRGAISADFTLDLAVGRTQLEGTFMDAHGGRQGAYYAYVIRQAT